jgi:tetratricopeptide (TPR) repeat protein
MRFTMPTVVLSLALATVVAAAAHPDTIVLKNGRRMVVESAKESGDRVIAETAAGEISLPKSLVERIEHTSDAAPAPAAQATSADPAADKIAIAPPAAQMETPPDPEVVRNAIHDGFVDLVYIARLDGAANRGELGAGARASAAHHAAAQFDSAKGDMDAALDQEEQALHFSPESLTLLLNVAYGHLNRSEYSMSLDCLVRAKKIAPNSADVAKLTGWADYGLNRVSDAVAEWKRAQQIQPDTGVAQALEKAERDERTESGFLEGQTNHFVVKYSGEATPLLEQEILRELEADFEQIRSTLNYTPPEPIGVILYTGQQFEDITRAPSWVGALYDGRLRIPVQGLTSMTDQLSRVLRHELTHSFLNQKTRGRCPVWLQEGIAQWMEGRRTGHSAAASLLAAYDNKSAIPLNDLEISWLNLSPTGANFAYGWSLVVVEYIISQNGVSDVEKILDTLTTTGSTEGAVRAVLHMGYQELEQRTADSLRTAAAQN